MLNAAHVVSAGIVVVALLTPLVHGTTTLHVDPAAAGAQSGAGSGSAASPFRTIASAQAAVGRMTDAEHSTPERVEIVLHGGDYTIESPIPLDERDSGRAGAPIIYRADGGEHPRLIGGAVRSHYRLNLLIDEAALSRRPQPESRQDSEREWQPRSLRFHRVRAAPFGSAQDDQITVEYRAVFLVPIDPAPTATRVSGDHSCIQLSCHG